MIPKIEGTATSPAREKVDEAKIQKSRDADLEHLRSELHVIYNTLQPSVAVTFKQLSSTISIWMQAQGFWDSDNFGEKVALIHSELSEALEAHRKEQASDHLLGISGVDEELADAVIRIFDLAGKLQIDLGNVLISKMLFNLNRPHKHGKAY